jgi:hypothetical protein
MDIGKAVLWYLERNEFTRDYFLIGMRFGMTEGEVMEGFRQLHEGGYIVGEELVKREGIGFEEAVLGLDKGRREKESRAIIMKDEMKYSHDWVRGGTHGGGVEGFLKTKYYPYPSHCKRCGLDWEGFNRDPVRCK